MDTVREARAAYFAANGFSSAEYDAKWTPVAFFALKLAIPNTPGHAWGIRLHDLHHVATGYGTDLVGEGEISCWEIAGGLEGLDLYVRSIICLVAMTGFCLSPRRMARAFRRGQKARSLWTDPKLRERDDARLEELLDLTMGELRERTVADSVRTGEDHALRRRLAGDDAHAGLEGPAGSGA